MAIAERTSALSSGDRRNNSISFSFRSRYYEDREAGLKRRNVTEFTFQSGQSSSKEKERLLVTFVNDLV